MRPSDTPSGGGYLSADDLLRNEAYEGVTCSILSNTFFIGGGLCSVLYSYWDWELNFFSNDDDYYVANYKTVRFMDRGILAVGPLVYLCNAFIDVAWALKAKAREEKRLGLEKFYIDSYLHAANSGTEDDGGGQDIYMALKKFEEHAKADEDILEGAIYNVNRSTCHVCEDPTTVTPTRILSDIRYYMGHRRDLMAAATFGIAAFLSLLEILCNMEIFDDLSIHVYLLSAIFALSPRPAPIQSQTVPQQQSSSSSTTPTTDSAYLGILEDAEALKNLGDLVFAVASVIDVMLCDFTFGDDIYWWPMIAAMMWLLDALLYLRSDFVTLYNTSPPTTMVQEILERSFDTCESVARRSLPRQCGRREALVQKTTTTKKKATHDTTTERWVWIEVV